MSRFYRIWAYLRHRIRSLISSRGYGVHSPYAFYLITEIINPRQRSYYYSFNAIEKQRYNWLTDHSKVTLKNGRQTTLRWLCKTSSTPPKDGQLLFKLALINQSKRIIEAGTSLGFGTAYLASISSQVKVISIDHDKTIQDLALKTFNALELKNITLLSDSLDKALPQALNFHKGFDFFFLDAHHLGSATCDYIHTALSYAHQDAVIILHDIHWSKDMYNAWMQIIDRSEITLSIELYNMGILYTNTNLTKAHYYA